MVIPRHSPFFREEDLCHHRVFVVVIPLDEHLVRGKVSRLRSHVIRRAKAREHLQRVQRFVRQIGTKVAPKRHLAVVIHQFEIVIDATTDEAINEIRRALFVFALGADVVVRAQAVTEIDKLVAAKVPLPPVTWHGLGPVPFGGEKVHLLVPKRFVGFVETPCNYTGNTGDVRVVRCLQTLCWPARAPSGLWLRGTCANTRRGTRR